MRGMLWILVLLVSLYVASATSCDNLNSVCFDASLNSELGYGAVEICDTCYRCGVADGVCPESFSDGESYASCSSCPDPDCVTTLSGYVFAAGQTNVAIDKASVSATIAEKEFSTLTSDTGFYSLELPRGAYRLAVSKFGYDTALVKFPLDQGANHSQYSLNVSLENGSCHSDCTGFSYDGQPALCKASCAGFTNNGQSCSFPTNTTEDQFYNAAVLCDQKPIGSKQIAFVDGDRSLVVECCSGEFFWQSRPAPKLSEELKVNNLVAKTLVGSLDGNVVRLRILVYA